MPLFNQCTYIFKHKQMCFLVCVINFSPWMCTHIQQALKTKIQFHGNLEKPKPRSVNVTFKDIPPIMFSFCPFLGLKFTTALSAEAVTPPVLRRHEIIANGQPHVAILKIMMIHNPQQSLCQIIPSTFRSFFSLLMSLNRAVLWAMSLVFV